MCSRCSRRSWDYLQGVTDKYGLRRYIRFNSQVDRAHWDDDECVGTSSPTTGMSSSPSS